MIALLLTLALSLGADATRVAGQAIVEASSQLLLIPQLLLVLLSTGMAPADSFPDWLDPFVRYQPVSQVTETLRGFASGHVVGRQSGGQPGLVHRAAGGVRRPRGADAEARTVNDRTSTISRELAGRRRALLFAGRLLTPLATRARGHRSRRCCSRPSC